MIAEALRRAGRGRQGRGRWIWVAAAVAVVVVACGALVGQMKYGWMSRDATTRPARWAERDSPAVAFVANVYAVEADGKEVARGAAEGTAFLVSEDGYLMTNRHVAAPWTEEEEMAEAAAKARAEGRKVRLSYRLMVWFNGQRALKKGTAELEGVTVEDSIEGRYEVEGAYKSWASPWVKIAGIMAQPRTLREALRSPLGDDVAFLKIDRAPEGVRPLRLPEEGAGRPKALEPVLVLGYPLGSTQNVSEEVTASATMGNIRRAFENVYQMSASIHPGNSGGPVVDGEGHLMGIASAAAVSGGVLGGGLSDFGMVMPAVRALGLYKELRQGAVKWDGVPYYGVEELAAELAEKGVGGDWAGARKKAEAEAAGSRDPRLWELLGLVRHGDGDGKGAEAAMERAVSCDPASAGTRLRRYALRWRREEGARLEDESIARAAWHESFEFGRFAARAMKGEVGETEALGGWDEGGEKSMLRWVVGVRRLRRGDREGARRLFEEAWVESGVDTAERMLAAAELSGMGMRGAPKTTRAGELKGKLRSRGLRGELWRELGGASEEEQVGLLRKVVSLDGDDGALETELAFRLAGEGDWKGVLEVLGRGERRPRRATATSMAAALLGAEALVLAGEEGAGRVEVERMAARKDWVWYPEVARDLIRRGRGPLTEVAKGPEEVVTLGAARGLWAEWGGDRKGAALFYRAALGSNVLSWSEYRLAGARLAKLTGSGEKKEEEGK